MKITATQAGSGQQAKSDLIVPANSQAVLDSDSAQDWTRVPAEGTTQSQDTVPDPSVYVAVDSNETAQESLALLPTQVGNSRLRASGIANPCPVCGRSKDGDCRIGAELVLCHHGSSHHPPDGLKPGDTVPGNDGQQWAFTGDTSDGRAATFTLHKPLQPPTTKPPTRGSESVWRYSDTFYVCRFPNKRIRPLSWIDGAWRWKAPEGKRPMLLSHPLAAKPKATVLVVEGEKTWDAARRLFPGLVVCCWSGGCKAIEKTNFTPLTGRKVVLWPDNDNAGRDAMGRLAQLLYGIGAESVEVVANPNDEPQGWDLADADWTPADAATWVKANTSEVAKQQQQPSKPASQQIAELLSYTGLMQAILAATIKGDDDKVMALKAEAITRFRRSDAQVEAALFKLHAQQETGAGQQQAPESLDLSRISGMDWLVEGFLPDNDQTLLWGDAGTGKTTAALALAHAVLKGTGLLDHEAPAARGGVLFIASDSGAAPLYAAMQDAGMADLPEAQEGPQKLFHVWAADAGQGMSAWAANLRGCIQLLEFIRRHRIRLVVIDSCKTACSGADLDYTNNQLVSALLTYFKEVICPHAAVVWLNHDGVARGAHAGAKAWKEVPSMVHRIIREENKDGSFVNSRRVWRVTKSRMGPTREFFYELNQGQLKLCPNQEKIGNCLDRVVEVLAGAWQLQGQASLSKADLVERICMTGGPSRKTLVNTLSAATRAKHPQVCRVASKRGHYKLAPRLLDSLKGHTLNGKEQGQNPVTDSVLTSSRQLPEGRTAREPNRRNGSQEIPDSVSLAVYPVELPDNFPREKDGNLSDASAGLDSGDVPSRFACASNTGDELVPLPDPMRAANEARIRELRPGTGDLSTQSDDEVAELRHSLEAAHNRRRVAVLSNPSA